MWCFNSELSDIDILVVVKNDISFNDKRELIDILLKLSNESIKKLERKGGRKQGYWEVKK